MTVLSQIDHRVSSEKVLKINQYLAKIWTKVWWHVSYGPLCIVLNPGLPLYQLLYWLIAVIVLLMTVNVIFSGVSCNMIICSKYGYTFNIVISLICSWNTCFLIIGVLLFYA